MSLCRVVGWLYEVTGPKLAMITPFRDMKYISMSLSLAPGIHASCTAPEQVGELKSAVKEIGGEGGARKERNIKYQ